VSAAHRTAGPRSPSPSTEDWGAGLAWLIVAGYAAHLAEEWIGGLPEWLARFTGNPMPRGTFLWLNAVGLTAMTSGVLAATRWPSLRWLIVAVATAALVNGLAHAVASLITWTYSPGLVTGVLLWVPPGLWLLVVAWREWPRAWWWGGVLTGLVAHAVVTGSAALASIR
jgi:hypothetical protein